jgi:hypothetical protein
VVKGSSQAPLLLIMKHTSSHSCMNHHNRLLLSTCTAWYLHFFSLMRIYNSFRVMMVLCGIYGSPLPHQLTRRDSLWTLCLIYEPSHFTMGFKHRNLDGKCNSLLHVYALLSLHKVEELLVITVNRMSESATWRCGPNPCHYFVYPLWDL